MLKIAVAAMKYETEHFGQLDINTDGIIHFPDGIIGFPDQRHWVLLAEEQDDAVGWLQSLTDPSLALSVITPHRYVPQYVLRVDRREFTCLPWSHDDASIILAVVSQHDSQLTANLKAPIIINLERGFGRQIIVADDQPLQYVLSANLTQVRKSA